MRDLNTIEDLFNPEDFKNFKEMWDEACEEEGEKILKKILTMFNRDRPFPSDVLYASVLLQDFIIKTWIEFKKGLMSYKNENTK